MDGEWLDHDDPRVNDLWRDRILGTPAFYRDPTEKLQPPSVAKCEAMLGEDAEYIEAAASYPEDSYGAMAARMAYSAPKDLG